jgi:serine/threonine protein kinase
LHCVESDNVLLGGGGEVKLADFGLAIELVKGAEKRRSILGTPFWMSPEIINGKDYDDKVDIWAMGVTTIEMMTKNPPVRESFSCLFCSHFFFFPVFGVSKDESAVSDHIAGHSADASQ